MVQFFGLFVEKLENFRGLRKKIEEKFEFSIDLNQYIHETGLILIEEKQLNNQQILGLISKDNYYQDILKAIHKYVSLNFNDDSIFEYLNIYNDEEELINFITKYQNDYINNKII